MNKKSGLIAALIVIILLVLGIYFLNKNKTITMNTEDNTADVSGALSEPDHAAENGDVLIVHYKGTLENGTQFDSSYDRGEPIGFILGKGMVIKGWDEGLIGVKKGEKKHLVIPGDKAYGDQEIKGPDGKVLIPKNATLVFDLEVMEIVPRVKVEEMMKAQADAAAAASSSVGTTTTQ